MRAIENIHNCDFDSIPVDDFWKRRSVGEQKEHKIHRIHAYPAKFPAFITTKALHFLKEENIRSPKRIADIFCGCGTTAFEAKHNSIDFWGCDVNPVATLIAETKSHEYQEELLQKYYKKIINKYKRKNIKSCFSSAPERLKYWYRPKQYNELFHLKEAILSVTDENIAYRSFFRCAFSNILKPTSRWLTKSIKPQIDPDKKPVKVLDAFKGQCEFMFSASKEVGVSKKTKSEIETGDFLNNSWKIPKVDMVITSPPYVTSYEYADLHQLSSLWLEYAEDYRELRKGTIGSLHSSSDRGQGHLNTTGQEIVNLLQERYKAKARSVEKVFSGYAECC